MLLLIAIGLQLVGSLQSPLFLKMHSVSEALTAGGTIPLTIILHTKACATANHCSGNWASTYGGSPSGPGALFLLAHAISRNSLMVGGGGGGCWGRLCKWSSTVDVHGGSCYKISWMPAAGTGRSGGYWGLAMWILSFYKTPWIAFGIDAGGRR